MRDRVTLMIDGAIPKSAIVPSKIAKVIVAVVCGPRFMTKIAPSTSCTSCATEYVQLWVWLTSHWTWAPVWPVLAKRPADAGAASRVTESDSVGTNSVFFGVISGMWGRA